MIKIKNIVIFLLFTFMITNVNASSDIKLNKVTIDLEDGAALKRGARIFFDYCQGCHGLKYMRYNNLADGIQLINKSDKKNSMLITEYFMHSTNIISENSPILTSLSIENGVKWFGKNPPDLSLLSRYRGNNWIYSYMKGFYKDESRPWGVNNLIFPDVGMPHILLKLQGLQILKDNFEKHTDIEKMLELIENGDISKEKYDFLIKDLVTFLSYVGEPIQIERKNLGFWVVLYCIFLSIILYFTKKAFWKDIK